MTNDELQRAINETVKASLIAPFAVSITLDQHLQRLTTIQQDRARGLPETQEPPLEFSRGQRLRSDVANAKELLKRCGFQVVIIDVDKYSAL